MIFNSKWLFATIAVLVFAFGLESESQAQRGFRIGNIFQAGGGQGFRLGGPRAGMHFGGGQGATIGTQRFGMRFGNGQGARFGGQYYGMQFGGGQGTQIGRLATTPSVAPGSYYYGTPQGVPRNQIVNPNPGSRQFAQPVISGQPTFVGPGVVPQTSTPGLSETNSTPNNLQPTPRVPKPAKPESTLGGLPTSQPEVDLPTFKSPELQAPPAAQSKSISVLNKELKETESQVEKSLSPAADGSKK